MSNNEIALIENPGFVFNSSEPLYVFRKEEVKVGDRKYVGFFTPRRVPTRMVELPEGGKVKTLWGESQGGPGSFLAKYGPDDYSIVTAADLIKFNYTGTNAGSTAKLAFIAASL